MNNGSNNNLGNNQNSQKPSGNFEYRGGAQTPTFRKPTPPPPPKSPKNNK